MVVLIARVSGGADRDLPRGQSWTSLHRATGGRWISATGPWHKPPGESHTRIYRGARRAYHSPPVHSPGGAPSLIRRRHSAHIARPGASICMPGKACCPSFSSRDDACTPPELPDRRASVKCSTLPQATHWTCRMQALGVPKHQRSVSRWTILRHFSTAQGDPLPAKPRDQPSPARPVHDWTSFAETPEVCP